MKLTDSTAFIAGATSGIGLGLARRLYANGATVIIGGRRSDRLAQIATELPVSTPSPSTSPTRPRSRARPRGCALPIPSSTR